MATKKQINEAFLSTSAKNDIEIETACYNNIKRIQDKDIEEIHENLMDVLEINCEEDSQYFYRDNFSDLVAKMRILKSEREEKAKKRSVKK